SRSTHDAIAAILGHYGQFKGRLSPSFSKNAILRMAQNRAHQDMRRRCELARLFVMGKLTNQRTLLQRYNRRQSDARAFQFTRNTGNAGMRQLAAIFPEARWFLASSLYSFLLKEA